MSAPAFFSESKTVLRRLIVSSESRRCDGDCARGAAGGGVTWKPQLTRCRPAAPGPVRRLTVSPAAFTMRIAAEDAAAEAETR